MTPSEFKGTFTIVTATPALEEIRASRVFRGQTITTCDQRKTGVGGFKIFEEDLFLLSLSEMMGLEPAFSELQKKSAARGEMLQGARFGFKIFDMSKMLSEPRVSSALPPFLHVTPHVVGVQDKKGRHVGSFESVSHDCNASGRTDGPYAPGISCRMLMSTKNNLLQDFLRDKDLIKEVFSYFEKYSREHPLD